MKDDSHSVHLLFLILLIFFAGFVPSVEANNEDYNYSLFDQISTGGTDAPQVEYPIWGYTGEPYEFTVKYKVPSEKVEDNLTMVFYWDSWGNTSDYDSFLMEDTNRLEWNYTNAWNKTGLYGISIGIFKETKNGKPEPVIVSYWMPIQIMEKNNTEIEVQTFFMRDEKRGLDGDKTKHVYQNEYYCIYLNDHYTFSAVLNASNQTSKVEKDEKIWAEFDWGDGTSDGTKRDVPGKMHNYTHRWEEAGEKNVCVRAVKRDFYNGSNNIYSNYDNRSVLVIKDPKNFIQSPNSYIAPFIEPFSNLQNGGIFLIVTSFMILFFSYTKNSVPVKVSFLGIKPLRLKSLNCFAGIAAFVAGMYLYFVFGRCPWDIPIVSNIDWLSNGYFSILYYEYAIKPVGIPYLSIVLGLGMIFALSMLIYLIRCLFFGTKV